MIILPGADRDSERHDLKPSQKYANLLECCKQLMWEAHFSLTLAAQLRRHAWIYRSQRRRLRCIAAN
jgi:hypothetical protein